MYVRWKGEWTNLQQPPLGRNNLMNIHELTPHSQATGLADSSLAPAELKKKKKKKKKPTKNPSQRLNLQGTTDLNVSEQSEI